MTSSASILRLLVIGALGLTGGCSSDGNGNADGGGGALRWYQTCGDPVCSPYDAGAPGGSVACTTEKVGGACTAGAAMCDPGVGCGVLLRCTDKDPRLQPGGCPISRRSYKRDVRYLDGTDLAALESQVRALRLARYRYKDAPGRERLGFMIDDVPGSPAVDEPRDMIDLYAYTSMVVATVQRQAARLDAQEREIARLRARLNRAAPRR
jgi:hypothetical protein